VPPRRAMLRSTPRAICLSVDASQVDGPASPSAALGRCGSLRADVGPRVVDAPADHGHRHRSQGGGWRQVAVGRGMMPVGLGPAGQPQLLGQGRTH
jgi:hypothetical protein